MSTALAVAPAAVSRVLVVEDNPDLAYGLRNSLEIAGHEVLLAADGRVGVTRALAERPDLVVLDLMLPELDGFRVLKALREAGLEVPVLVLTARGEEADKVAGFRLGADDYVTKPFGVLELLARIEALLRRSRPAHAVSLLPLPEERSILTFGDVEVDASARHVRRAGETVELTPKELDLLLALAKRPGCVRGRGELLSEVWGYGSDVMSRTVDTHIAELRRKLEPDPAEPRHIVTVWKAGYRLEA